MLEFPDKGNMNWLLKKRELAVSYHMESEEASTKRKRKELLANDELVKSEPHYSTASSFDQKRIRLREDSSCSNNNDDEGYNHHRMRLDLELNLSPSLIDLNHDHYLSNHDKNCEENERKKKKMMEKGSVLGLETRKNMAWVAFDLDEDGHGCRGGDNDGSEAEMVARVCMKCHMLVILCKASPACPNCKFMHSPEDASLTLLFNPKPTLLA